MRQYIPIALISFSHLNTNRETLPYVWAEDADEQYAATDPDLDTEHFLYIEDRYTKIGWQSGEVEPEQWQNFLQQISDLKIKECVEYGFFNWFSDVQYKVGSLCFYSGVLYKSVSDANLGNTPSSTSQYWTEVCTVSGTTYTQTISELSTSVTTHINSVGEANPHQDDADTIGGYTQAEIDNMFSVDNPDTMAHHIADENNPHEVTHVQLNSLSAIDGGVFTGTVCFSGGIASGVWRISWLNT